MRWLPRSLQGLCTLQISAQLVTFNSHITPHTLLHKLNIGNQLTASRSLSIIASSSSKCRSLISSFFICVSTSRATKLLILRSSTDAKCCTYVILRIVQFTSYASTEIYFKLVIRSVERGICPIAKSTVIKLVL